MAITTDSFSSIYLDWNKIAMMPESDLCQLDSDKKMQLFAYGVQFLSKDPTQIQVNLPLMGRIVKYIPKKGVSYKDLHNFFDLLKTHHALFEQGSSNRHETKKIPNPTLLKIINEALKAANDDVVVSLLDRGFPVKLNTLRFAFEHGRHEAIESMIKNNSLPPDILFKLVDSDGFDDSADLQRILFKLIESGADIPIVKPSRSINNSPSFLRYVATKCPMFLDVLFAKRARLSIDDVGPLIDKFESLKLTSQQRIQLIYCCFEANEQKAGKRFEEFAMESEDDRIKLFNLIIDKKLPFDLTDHYGTFKISDEKIRFQHAQRYSESYPYYTASNSLVFNLNPENRKKLALFIAESHGDAVAYNIGKFELNSSDDLYEIALVCAQSHAGATIFKLDQFNIQDRNQILEVVKICAHRDGLSTASFFPALQILDERERINLFKICMLQNGESIKKFKEFAISDEQAVEQLLSSCARENPIVTGQSIHKFKAPESVSTKVTEYCFKLAGIKIFPEASFFALESTATVINPRKATTLTDIQFSLKESIASFNGVRLEMEEEEINNKLNIILLELKLSFIQDLRKLRLDHQLNEIQTTRHVATKYQRTQFLLEILFLQRVFNIEKLTESQLEFIGKSYSFPRSDISLLLIRGAYRSWIDPSYEEVGSFGVNISPAYDAVIKECLIRLELLGFKHNFLTDTLGEINSNVTFKDGKSLQIFIEVLSQLILIDTDVLGVNNKISILRRIFTEGKIDAQTKANKRLENSSKGSVPRLKQTPTTIGDHISPSSPPQNLGKGTVPLDIVPTNRELGKAYVHAMQALVAICAFSEAIPKLAQDDVTLIKQLEAIVVGELGKIKISEFDQKFDLKFLQTRSPLAVLSLIGRIKSTFEPANMNCLAECITSVLEGNDAKLRYSEKSNPHLKAVENASPGILQKWGKCLQPLKSVQTEIERSETSLTIDKICEYFGQVELNLDLNYLTQYLLTNDAQERKTVFKSCTDMWNKTKKSTDKSADFMAQKNTIKLESRLLELVVTKHDRNQLGGKRQGMLKGILDTLNYLRLPENAKKEIEKLVKTIKDLEEYVTAFESDNITDFLNVGTEIADSCLKLTGDSKNIKGLLAYIRDGKIKILKISDSDDPEGVLKARCILRILLLDGKPVLFREKFYPNSITEKQKCTLDQLALKKGEELGLPVYIKIDKGEHLVTLQSLQGPAPWEYSDGAGGNMKNGIYNVTTCKKIAITDKIKPNKIDD